MCKSGLLSMLHLVLKSRPQQTNQCMAFVLAGARIGEGLARHRAQPKCVVEFNNPASEVTTEP